MNINYTMIVVVMFFVVLITIQLTLNKILVILKEIKGLLMNNKIRNDYDETTKKY